MTPEQRTQYAKELLDNPVFLECVERINLSITRDMDKVKNDEKLALSLIRDRQAVNKVIAYFYTASESAKVTEFNKKKRFNF